MGGGLLQLVAYGAQDVYLTGNPQITFFKVVYRRHTNFSIESIQQTFNGNATLGNRVTCQISRNGDLVHKMYLQVKAKVEAGDLYLQPYYGYKLIKHVELEIGGQRIDKQYGEWMYIWNELTMEPGKKKGFMEMVGGNEHNVPVKFTTASDPISLYIPLEFWFCRNVGLALPLIALQYHEVKVNIEFNTLADFTALETGDYILASNGAVSTTINVAQSNGNFGSSFDATLWADYIFLDTDERKRFAQLSHEYLIEQLQFTGEDSITGSENPSYKNFRLSFNHPVKELVWVSRPDGATDKKINWNNFTDNEDNNNELAKKNNPTVKAKLQLNGNDRFAERDGNYFSLVQPYQHHTNIPSNPGINVYSFALKPEEHQPSGTLNMSRIDTAQLQIANNKSGKVFIYAVNYNVLRILSGMGGLAYSN